MTGNSSTILFPQNDDSTSVTSERTCTSASLKSSSASRLALYIMREELKDSASEKEFSTHHAHDFFVISSCKIKASLRLDENQQTDTLTSKEDSSHLAEIKPIVPGDNEEARQILQRFGLTVQGRSNRSVEGLKKTVIPQEIGDISEFCKKIKGRNRKDMYEAIYKLILRGRENGVSCQFIRQLETSYTRQELVKCLKDMISANLILRFGIVSSRFVARKYASPWLLHSFKMTRVMHKEAAPKLSQSTGKMLNLDKGGEEHCRRSKLLKKVEPEQQVGETSSKMDWGKVDEIDVIPRPWIKIDGNLNRRVLDRLLGAVLGHVMQRPGIPLRSLFGKMSPAIQPMHCLELLELLQDLDCVALNRLVITGKVGLFSSKEVTEILPADILDEVDDVIVESATDAIAKLGKFIGDKQYTHDFIAQCTCHPDKFPG